MTSISGSNRDDFLRGTSEKDEIRAKAGTTTSSGSMAMTVFGAEMERHHFRWHGQ